jgi:uncharacterized membrane-anchored protein
VEPRREQHFLKDMSATTTTRDHYVHAKVPETITPWFWATKILMTATGEAISDAMNQQLGPAIALPIMLILLAVTLRWQFRQDRYRTGPYWSVVAAVSIFGTSAADAFHVGIGMPYWSTTLMYAVVVTVIFVLWHRSEGTLDIHSIVNRRRERFYWFTVLGSFALGTATGDWTAVDLHIDYLPSFLLFGVIILIPLVLWRRGVNAVFTFWFAYTITRPFGASWADYSDMPINQAGLNLGQIPTSIYLAVITVALVAYMHARRIGYHDDVPVTAPNAAADAVVS